MPTDVASPASVAALFARVAEQWGRVDLLFNNAGTFGTAAAFDEVAFEDWQAVVDTNLPWRVPVRAGGVPGDARPAAARRAHHQ